MEQRFPQIPDTSDLNEEDFLTLMNIYIANNISGTDENGAPYHIPEHAAKKFIVELMGAFQKAHIAPDIMNQYLEIIANKSKIDPVIDEALSYQDKLIKRTPSLKSGRDFIEEEYKGLIGAKPL